MMFVLVLPRLAPARDAESITNNRAARDNRSASIAAPNSSSKKSLVRAPIEKAAKAVKNLAEASEKALDGRLARLTAYWSGEGDYYTRHHLSATGVRLHEGHCAVDPKIIPYGSVVQIAGLGNYLAVDTGTAVVSRQAAKEAGHNRQERSALVIDLYFESRADGEEFAANGPKYASVSWSKPDGDAVLGMSASAVSEEAPIAAEKPVAKPEAEASPMKPVSRAERKVAAAKPEEKVAPKIVAAAKPVSHSAGSVASAKAVSKHDTQDTASAAWSPNSKGEVKLGALKTDAASASKATPAQGAKPAQTDEGAEHVLLAQSDAAPHHKALYQF